MQLKHFPALMMLFSSFAFFQTTTLSQMNNPEAKRTNHWYFGDKAGLDFSSGTAVADTNGKMGVYAGCSSISDINGNLAFYTNGIQVWNRNHQVMPNGTGLYGTGTPYQGSVIVPQPKSDSIYYIFYQNGTDATLPTANGLHYAIVDISLNNGLGDVTQKNIRLTDSGSFEQLAAVHHANKCDVWVMTHEHHTNNFLAFLVTDNGVSTAPVITTIGNQLYNAFFDPYNIGLLPTLSGSKFSNDGKRFVTAVYWDSYYTTPPFRMDTLELFDFNNTTGVLSNLIKIPDSNFVGLAFSPDGSKLYTSISYEDAWVFQYDISSYNLIDILASKTQLYYAPYWDISDFQETVDKKIIGLQTLLDSVTVIHNPNQQGINCNFQWDALWMDGKSGKTALPNFIQSYFGADTTGCLATGDNESYLEDVDNISIYPNPVSQSATVRIQDGKNEPKEIILYDAIGNVIQQYRNTENIFKLDRGHLPSGIYLLKVQCKDKLHIKKIIIANF